MTGTRSYGIDRRGRRLWIQISSSDWELIEEQARRRYVSASGLISQIAAEWCDAELNRRRKQTELEDRIDAMAKGERVR